MTTRFGPQLNLSFDLRMVSVYDKSFQVHGSTCPFVEKGWLFSKRQLTKCALSGRGNRCTTPVPRRVDDSRYYRGTHSMSAHCTSPAERT